jgi:uncharacterized repeat protein (TIGR03803 family)
MKSRTQESIRAAYPGCSHAKWTWIIAICLLTALAMPVVLAAQSAPGYNQRVLYTFTGGTDGSTLYGDLIQDEQGNLYGTTELGGDPTCMCGTAFKLDPAGNFTVLHTFTGAPDGVYPFAGLTRDSDGNLYGTTMGGGANGGGTVFKIDAEGHESILYSFGGADGSDPVGGLFRDADGSLYGTTNAGGNLNDCNNGCGVVFKLDPSNKFSQLYAFKGAPDGNNPKGRLVRDANGNFYGTTFKGGTSGVGTVYKLSPNPDGTWTESVLYSFTGGADGGEPFSGVILDPNGNLWAPQQSSETVSIVEWSSKLTALAMRALFTPLREEPMGGYPVGGLVRDPQGNLYGTANGYGNQTGNGTVFKLNPAAKETTLYQFSGLADGGGPGATLVRDHNGNLFGTTENGGDDSACGGIGCGVIFEISACPTATCRVARDETNPTN